MKRIRGYLQVEERRFAPSTNRRIFWASVVIAVGAVLAKLASTAKELVVANLFGRSDALDAFLIALLVPSFVVSLVAGSFNAALIPTFIQVRGREGWEAAQQLLSSVMVWSLCLLLGLSIILGLLAPYYLPLVASGFPPDKLLLTRCLLYMLLPFIVLNGLVANWSAILNAGERFALPAISPVLTPAVIMLLLLPAGRGWGVFPLALGTVGGSIAEAMVLGWALRKRGVSLKPAWRGLNRSMRQVIGQYVPAVAAVFLMSSTSLIDQSMAAMLQPGSVAALNYGTRVINVITGVGSSALATAVLPYFSSMVAQRDWAGCRHTLRTYSRLIALVTIPITLGLTLASHVLIKVLYQRGAFSAEDTNVVSSVQMFLSMQIPFYMLGIIGVRLINALKKNSLLVAIAGANAILNVTLNYVFMKSMGVAGIALSTSLVYLASCTMVFAALFVSWGKRDEI
jgi:putative peptidoglycan lipid II flippase